MSTNENRHSSSDPTERTEREAAAWLIQRDRGFTPRELLEFDAWMASNPRHPEIFAEIAEGWGRLDRLRIERPEFGSPKSQRRPRRAWVPVMAAAAAIIAVIGFVELRAPAGTFSETAVTAAGTSRTIQLPDGSIVQLSPESSVSVFLTPDERRVRLIRGEANFQVAKNPARPFIVSAGRVAVRAVGTVFDVQLRSDAIEVEVTEGKVRVDDSVQGKSLLGASVAGSPPLLVAGQKAVVPVEVAAESLAVVTSLAEADLSPGSQGHRLEFVSVPLAEIVVELNRSNQHKLVIADPKLGALRFGGTFFSGDDETLVRMLEQNFSVTAERRGDEIVLRLAQR